MDEFFVPELEPAPEERPKRIKKPKAHWSTKRTTWLKEPSAYGKLERKESVAIISAMTGFTNAETAYFFDAFCALIFFELANGRDFYLTHAGTIRTTLKKQKVYPHRFTGEMMTSPLSARMTFRQSKYLKQEIKNLPEELKQALIKRRAKEKQDQIDAEDENFI
jgi:nucleoid DNA-binding protein